MEHQLSLKRNIFNSMRRCYWYLRKYKLFEFSLEKIKKLVVLIFPEYSVKPRKYDLISRPGVNMLGFVNSEKGMGEASRLIIKALSLTNWSYVVNRYMDKQSYNQEEIGANHSEENPFNINLIAINVDAIYDIYLRKRRKYFKHRYTIFYCPWETEELPKTWQDALACVDELWVPSHFVKRVAERVSPVPVMYMPYAISIKTDPPKFDRNYFQLPEDTFIFLFIFDFDSILQRKNPHGLIRAFNQAFSESDNVLLLIKSFHADNNPNAYKILSRLARKKNIRFFDHNIPKEEIESLMRITDCYISLHRSEGFGLTIAEAMSFGKPVITTAYSGNVDFMSGDNCYPVGYHLIETQKQYGPYPKGSQWAAPDLAQAAHHMRFVYENREHAYQTGQRARDYMRTHFSPEVVANRYQERLQHIARFTHM